MPVPEHLTSNRKGPPQIRFSRRQIAFVPCHSTQLGKCAAGACAVGAKETFFDVKQFRQGGCGAFRVSPRDKNLPQDLKACRQTFAIVWIFRGTPQNGRRFAAEPFRLLKLSRLIKRLQGICEMGLRAGR